MDNVKIIFHPHKFQETNFLKIAEIVGSINRFLMNMRRKIRNKSVCEQKKIERRKRLG